MRDHRWTERSGPIYARNDHFLSGMDADGSKTVQHHSIYQRQMGTSVGGVYGICGVSFRSTKGEEAQPFLVDCLSLGMEPAEKVG